MASVPQAATVGGAPRSRQASLKRDRRRTLYWSYFFLFVFVIFFTFFLLVLILFLPTRGRGT